VDGTTDRLDLPSFPDEPAVQQVYLCAYLPENQVLLSSDGDWSNEQRGAMYVLPIMTRPVSDAKLVQWVTEGNKPAATSADRFPRGKSHLHVYSTLRPQAAPEGSLRMVTMDRHLFQGLVLLVIAGVGLPLFRRSLRSQLILLLLITVAVLLLGMFAPELARTLFAGVFPIAIVVLIAIWLMGHVSRLRRSRAAPASAGEPADRNRPFAAGTQEAGGGMDTGDEPPGGAPPDEEHRAAGEEEQDEQPGGGRHDA
jgi:hypothetical protein